MVFYAGRNNSNRSKSRQGIGKGYVAEPPGISCAVGELAFVSK